MTGSALIVFGRHKLPRLSSLVSERDWDSSSCVIDGNLKYEFGHFNKHELASFEELSDGID